MSQQGHTGHDDISIPSWLQFRSLHCLFGAVDSLDISAWRTLFVPLSMYSSYEPWQPYFCFSKLCKHCTFAKAKPKSCLLSPFYENKWGSRLGWFGSTYDMEGFFVPSLLLPQTCHIIRALLAHILLGNVATTPPPPRNDQTLDWWSESQDHCVEWSSKGQKVLFPNKERRGENSW